MTRPNKKVQPQNDKATLAEIFGVPAENLLVCAAAESFGEEIETGDLLFADSARQPVSSNRVLCESENDLTVKLFSEIEHFQPLRLITRNGELVESKTKSVSFEIVGVVTHVVRTLTK